jgi:uncharacterized protein
MPFEEFSQPSLYLDRVRPMLESRETENNLILGVTLRLVEHPEWINTPPYLAAFSDRTGWAVLAAAITPPHNILLAADRSLAVEDLEPALQQLFSNLKTGGWSVPGVLAEDSLALSFSAAWSRQTGQAYRVNMHERIYELRQVIPPANPPSGLLRQAGLADLALVENWNYLFAEEALGQGSREDARRLAEQRIPVGDVFLWDDCGPVSMAYRARPTPHGQTVTSVYTPPELRGRGYASACVAGVSQLLLDSGKHFCNLFTNLANPTSNSIYQKIGYRPVCDFTEYLFG